MKKIKSQAILFSVLLSGILFAGCGKKFVKSPVDVIIRDMPKEEVFSIVLHDIDVKGNFSKSYYHSYEIINGSDPETIKSRTTDWHEVSEREFNRYINDMGMEVAARDSTGRVTKSVAPPRLQ